VETKPATIAPLLIPSKISVSEKYLSSFILLISALHETQKNNNINELGLGGFRYFLLSNSILISTAYSLPSTKKPLFPLKFTSSKGGWRAKKLQKNTS